METDAKLFGTTSEAQRPEAGYRAVEVKYGRAAVAGFQAVPDLLLKKQSDLGLSATDVVVLLNVLMHWWYPEQKPFPRPTTIASRMGVVPRTVQRSISAMCKDGRILIKEKAEDGRVYLNPEPLVKRLEELATDDRDYGIRIKKHGVAQSG